MEASQLKSFVEVGPNDDFPIQNIPFGAFTRNGERRCASAIGSFVIDLQALEANKLFNGPLFSALKTPVFANGYLNDFMELGRGYWVEVRETLQALLSADNATLKDNAELRGQVLIPSSEVTMVVPARIGDYTDFYSSKNHAFNVGVMFRGKDNALQPNWTHLPVGYHGRASSIVASGTEIRRPKGQIKPADSTVPLWSECKRLDFELEMGAYVGGSTKMGEPIKISEARDHIFGLTVLNDWSARDIQAWEYVPLGPFNAKNFASTVSPWIITLEALAPFRTTLPDQDPVPMDYLKETDHSIFDVTLDVNLQLKGEDKERTISTSNLKHMYWNFEQQLTHHTVTGCNFNSGDFFGTGTISGLEKETYGSLLEICWAGKEPMEFENGEKRTFLQDGDTVNLKGYCQADGYRIGFGDCSGKILPAHSDDRYF